MKRAWFFTVCFIGFVSCDTPITENPVDSLLKLSKSDTLSYKEREHYCEIVLDRIDRNTSLDSISLTRLNLIGWSYVKMKNWDQAKQIFSTVKELSHNSKTHLADSYYGLGKIHENKSSNDSSYYYYHKAQKIYREVKDKLNECLMLQEKAKIQYFANDYLGADQNLIYALRIAKLLEYDTELFYIYKALGVNANEQQDYEEAEKYYLKAMEMIPKIENIGDDFAAQINFVIGNNEFRKGNVNRAYKYYRTAYGSRLNRKIYNDLSFQILDNIGYCHLIFKKYSSSRRLLLFTARSRDSLKILQGKNFNKLYLSQYYQATKNIPLAIQYGKEALALSKEFKAPNDVLKCLKYLAELDKFNALNYTKQYIRLSDSIQRRERETRNKFAKIEYETEELLREKELSAERKSLFLTMALLASSACLLAGVIYALKSRQQEMEYFQRQQKVKEEIFSLIQEGHSKMESGRNIEKKRIARELHDGVMNKLASTRFNLYRLKDNSNVETIRKCITYIDHLQEIEQEIRNVAYDLNKEVFTEKETFDRALVGLLDQYIEGNVAEVKQHINKDINWDEVQNGIKIDIYRILQESLQNIKKYARAFRVSIILDVRDRSLFLEVADDGVGFEFSEIEAGLGLTNIQARAKENAGSAQIISQKSKGTIIRVIFPDYKT